MPRHDPSKTPPERRRATKGARVGRSTIHHTSESKSDLLALQARWRCGESEAARKAFRFAVEQGDDIGRRIYVQQAPSVRNSVDVE
jgi:hypothetical protein